MNTQKLKLKQRSFFWQIFCDNYLEVVKKRIYNNKEGKESAQYTLYTSLLTILKLIAPIMPFITEEIYQENFKKQEKDKSIHTGKWPEYEKGKEQEKTEDFDLFIEILGRIRQEKSNNKKAMNAEILLSLDEKDYSRIHEMLEDLKDVTCAKEIKKEKFKVEIC